ncbi:ABC transporter ATP-binding protein [Arthrobacter cryoconiti]|uniref:ABC transporter ATP-binding protein n=1 Tax=Arthrobacter cryoconiti TaxID=748907 RepID=A0ABV8R3S8_9MICC|nr:ATP-binding cassette domain-containing protein [Arthrobacter cryoconiti]MCC9067113.1 ATP-binding cassette domain-containing protein [Arthrobacter cryoconiti]
MSELEFRNVSVRFGRGRHSFLAVDDVNLIVPPRSIVGLVGESGSGKSTLARAAVGLCEPVTGTILLDGDPISHARGARAAARQRVQMVFQDPYACLDPRRTVGQSLLEALETAARRRGERLCRNGSAAEVTRLLESVHLSASYAAVMPATLSGGQRQRVALARVLAAEPRVILADEVTSALDVSVQGSVLNLLKELAAELGFSVLFISHNLAVVRYLCDSVAVMKSGRLIEQGGVDQVLQNPREDYTRKLLAAVPRMGHALFATGGNENMSQPIPQGAP